MIETSQELISTSVENRRHAAFAVKKNFNKTHQNLLFAARFRLPVEFRNSELKIITAKLYSQSDVVEFQKNDIKLIQLSDDWFARNQERAREESKVVTTTMVGFSVALNPAFETKQFEVYIVASACKADKCVPLSGRFLVEAYEEKTFMLKAKRILDRMMSV